MRNWMRQCIINAVLLAAAPLATVTAGDDAWVDRSNENAQLVLAIWAEFFPEGAGALGVPGLDEEIMDLGPELHERTLAAGREVLAKLETRLETETDPRVRQDLQILIIAVNDNMRTAQLERDNLLAYFNIGQTVFRGVRALIDPQIPAERYPAAVVRLRKYAGMEDGYEPLVDLARARTRERLGVAGLVGPYRGEVEQDLERAETMISGLSELLEESGVAGWEEPYEQVAGQLRAYNEWVREEVLSRARDDYRLPPVLYEDALRNWGVDAAPEALIQTATQGYMDIRNEMQALASLVAREKGYETNDYREVIQRLKEEVIPGDELLDYYYARLADIEAIIAREGLVTLPERDAGIRIATAAETAVQPAAHLEVPRLIGNTGEYPEFVLPKLGQNADGSWPTSDDSFEAGTWTLTAHEARPGHELQYSSMIETGVSITRVVFAFNSANVEGWALYAEAITKPHMPLAAQLISLQWRMTRAARMFLDPMLNLGRITPEEAKRLLMEDVVLDESTAQNEVERYTYRMPGQATAYFFGYSKLQALRTQTELVLGKHFDQTAFHDFILAQGLLPPELLKKVVMEDFVPRQMKRPSIDIARAGG